MSLSVPPIEDIAAFVAVAQNGGFTRAAEQLGSNKSNLGKAVQRIEARLGTKLFHRTTRTVRLTEDGEVYLTAARAALAGLSEAEAVLAARREDAAGRVRVDLAVGLGAVLIPGFADLRARHPAVTLDLMLSDRPGDAAHEGADIIVRIGELPAAGEAAVYRLCTLRSGLYASTEYLAERGPVRSIDDLRGQDGVVFRTGAGTLRPWFVADGGRVVEIAPEAAVIAADGRVMLDSIRAGLGVAQIFDRVAAPFVATGELVHLLPDCDVAGPGVHALVPRGRRMTSAARVVLEHIGAVLANG